VANILTRARNSLWGNPWPIRGEGVPSSMSHVPWKNINQRPRKATLRASLWPSGLVERFACSETGRFLAAVLAGEAFIPVSYDHA
jgi:hypothetical protein